MPFVASWLVGTLRRAAWGAEVGIRRSGSWYPSGEFVDDTLDTDIVGECVPFRLEKTLSAGLSSSDSNPESLTVFARLIRLCEVFGGELCSTSLTVRFLASSSSRRASFSCASSSTRFIIASSCSASLTDMSSNCIFRCRARVSAPSVSSASASFSAAISRSCNVRFLHAVCSRERRSSACCCRFLNAAGGIGSAGPAGKRALLTFMSSSSSSRSGRGVVGLVKEALLEKSENRLAIADFDAPCVVELRCRRLDGRISEDEPIVPRGLDFSFVGDGKIPTLIGADSPLNQSASFPTFSSVLPCVVESLRDKELAIPFCLVGEHWRGCCAKNWNSFRCGEELSLGRPG